MSDEEWDDERKSETMSDEEWDDEGKSETMSGEEWDEEFTLTENNAVALKKTGGAGVDLFTMLVRGVEQERVDLSLIHI